LGQSEARVAGPDYGTHKETPVCNGGIFLFVFCFISLYKKK
jgi:hypothetical protein